MAGARGGRRIETRRGAKGQGPRNIGRTYFVTARRTEGSLLRWCFTCMAAGQGFGVNFARGWMALLYHN